MGCEKEFENPFDPKVQLQSPNLTSPPNNIILYNQKPEFSWEPIKGANIFSLIISKDSDFDDIIINETSLQ
jgi:hypothetical protein